MNNRKPYNLIRPYCMSKSTHSLEKNIFASLAEEGNVKENYDVYEIGQKEMRVYKNKIKRKQKLTPAAPLILKQLT
jgi:hypothetical protein